VKEIAKFREYLPNRALLRYNVTWQRKPETDFSKTRKQDNPIVPESTVEKHYYPPGGIAVYLRDRIHRLLVLLMAVIFLLAGCETFFAEEPQWQPKKPTKPEEFLLARTANATLRIHVTDDHGRPLARAKVVPVGSGIPDMEAFTDERGVFEWDVPAGTVQVNVQQSGFRLEKVMTTLSKGKVHTVKIRLKKN
jgi:hypothetical protein